jgi:zinc finger FYVE domain-containing protein 26
MRKLTGVSDISSNSERNRDADDASSDAGSSSVGSQSTDELSELLTQADIWLGRADKESSARLRDRLIVDERYSMAVYTCKKCKVNIMPDHCCSSR